MLCLTSHKCPQSEQMLRICEENETIISIGRHFGNYKIEIHQLHYRKLSLK